MDVKLSDNLRRLMCRAGFVLICLLPTFITLRAILVPVTTDQWTTRIEQHLGSPLQLGQAATPTPQRTELRDLQIGDDGFQSQVSVDRVSIKNIAGGRVIRLGTVTGSVAAVSNALHRIDAAGTSLKRSHRSLTILVDRVVFLRNPDANSTQFELSNVSAQIELPGDQWRLEFSVPHTIDTEHATKTCSIQRSSDSEQTLWQIECGEQPIPGWVVAGFCPSLQFVGPDSKISGRASLFQRGTAWSGQISDLELSGVDLEQLVWQRFGHAITGLADIRIQSATIADSRLFKLTGDLLASGGTIGASLLNACQDCAGMQIVTPWNNGDVRYGQIRLGFRIADFQLAVFAPTGSDAIVLSDNGAKILIPRSGHPLPVSCLLSVLSWPRHQSAPINQHTAQLAAHLAWPPLPHEFNDRFSIDRTSGEPLQSVGERILR